MEIIGWQADLQVYLCREAVDFRKGASSLAVLVEQSLRLDPFARQVVVFRNARCTAVKVLYWERNGFCLWQKRLERERFHWPTAAVADEATVTLSGAQLGWLLQGYDLTAWRAHRSLRYASVL